MARRKYVPPIQVLSPKRKWTLIAVLDDEGEAGSALAVGRWEEKPVLAMRWNGDQDNSVIGNPQSRGLPTWFILPAQYNEAILRTLPPDKLALARNFLPKPNNATV